MLLIVPHETYSTSGVYRRLVKSAGTSLHSNVMLHAKVGLSFIPLSFSSLFTAYLDYTVHRPHRDQCLHHEHAQLFQQKRVIYQFLTSFVVWVACRVYS